MGTSRTSNKDVMAAIERLTAAITGIVVQQAPAPQASAPTVAVVNGQNNGHKQVKVSEEYLGLIRSKAQAKATETGDEYVLYARRNLANQTKLAFCKTARFPLLRDNGMIGRLDVIKPAK